MVTKKEIKEGWTNIRIKIDTLQRLKIIKARRNHPLFDQTINEALDLLEKNGF